MCETQIWTDTEKQPIAAAQNEVNRDKTERVLPLSTAQTGMWFAQKLSSPDTIFNLAEAIEIHGPIDPALFETSVRQAALEADTIRVRFIETAEGPRQIIALSFDADIPIIDVSAETDPREAAEHWMMAELTRPVDLLIGPLWISALFKLAPDYFIWYHRSHHIIMDGFTGGLFARRVADLYTALVNGLPKPEAGVFAPLSLLIEEDAAYRHSERFTRDRDYWMGRFADRPEPLSLANRQSPKVGCLLRQTSTLPSDSVDVLRHIARKAGASLSQILIAAAAVYLYRVTGVQDLVIGLPVTARTNGRQRQVPGMVANVVPLRLAMRPSLSITELLCQVGREVRQILRHQSYRYEDLRRDLNLLAENRHLFTTVINVEPFNYALRFAGHPVTPHNLSNGSINELDIFIYDRGDDKGLRIDFDANPALYNAEELAAHQRRFLNLVKVIARDPGQRIGRIDILDPAERRRVLVEFNATAAAYPQDRLIHELFEAQAARQPDAVAVVFEDRQLTYGELNARANRLAHYLREQGVGPDTRVAICLERSLEMIVGLLAVLKAGGAYVPLDPAYPAERLAYMLADAAPRVLLTQERLRDSLPAAAASVIMLDRDWDRISGQADTSPAPQALGLTPRHLAYVIYTSGSTGQPKGVMVEHERVVNFLKSMQSKPGMTTSDSMLAITTLSFDIAALEIYLPLISGGRLVLANHAMIKDGSLLATAIDDFQVTIFQATPATWRLLLSANWHGQSKLKALCGGEALSTELAHQIQHKVGVLWNLYGPTETTIWSCLRQVSVEANQYSCQAIESIGRPIANTQIYILDDRQQPVPVGVAGELHIGGAGVARGYLNRPELTAERFIADPFSNDPLARLYRTGDLGRWLEDGNIEFLGRNDHQVKLRGFRIELGEIEARLAACAGVREAVVIAREDRLGDKRLVAYLTALADTNLDIEALRTPLKAVLPEYMLPSAFVILDALPLTPNGKLDRKALPAPEAGAYGVCAYEAPVGETEQALAAIWAELLKLDQVGRHDNFFELGGHSLLAMTLIARMRQIGLNIDVRALFAAPTLVGLAALADSGSHAEQLAVPANRIPDGCTAITPDLLPLVNLEQADIDRIIAAVPGGAANVQDIYPLAPLQEGILFHHLMESEGDAYLLPSLLVFDTRERLDSFLTTLQAVIARHDILRTAIAWEGLPEPVQVVWREAQLAIEEVILDPEAGEAAEQLLDRYDPRHYRLDVRVAPLINGFTAYDAKERRWLLLLLMHHLAIDHTALEILLEEIRMHQLGLADQLPAPLPFRNFVAQARLGVSREEHEAFFRKMLADVDEPTAPFGLLDVQGDGSEVEEAKQDLDLDLARRLREQARTLGISVASLFHLAWAAVVSRTSGRDDVVFGTVLFGRMQGDEGAGRVLGMFINTLPLRVHQAQGSVLEQVRDVQTRLAGLLRHEHAPLSLAQRCSAVPAPAPLFSALLNYRHSQSDASADYASAWQGIEVLSGEERTNYPITLSVDDLGEGFSLTAQTLPPVAPERLCAMLHTALDNLITALESAPDTAMRQIGVLPEAERRQVLYDWNTTAADYPQDCCIHELFEAQVRNTPEAAALVFEDQHLTYAELNVKANQLAHYLRSLGVKPDDRVAICLERSIELVISLLAVLKAGAAYVPLDPANPEERLAFMLEDSAPLALLTDSGLKARLADRPAGARLIDLFADAAQWAHQPADNPDLAVVGLTPAHLAYVIYTSGSTGQPKGVMVPHAGVVNLVSWHNRQFQVSAADRATQLAGLAFDASAWETWPYLSAGACLHLVRSELLGQPEALWQQLADDRITIAFMPTPLAELMLAELMLAAPRPGHLALRCLLTGGDRLHGHPPAGLPFELVNNYGPTENSVVSTSCPVPAGGEGLPPIGRPIANTRVYLLNDSLAPVPVGVVGELHVSGAGLARGYLNRPELTAERFIQDPFSDDPQARLYKTGDLGRWREDGSIEFLGRNDFQVKIRGFRIEPGEIETRLAEHPAIKETAVLAREDGPGDKRLVAYYTGDAGLSVDGLRAHLAETLPKYMVPAAFVQLEALPLTANGKLDRKALPEPNMAEIAKDRYAAPVTETEKTLAAIWSGILGIEHISRQDDFFALGGHSLLVPRLQVAVQKQFNIQLPLKRLFEMPTVAAQARLIDTGESGETLVDLEAEAILDAALIPLSSAPIKIAAADAVFLTGATGFLGTFLLAELLEQTHAKIYCLIRAANEQEALARLQRQIGYYELQDKVDWCRVIAVCGDLAKPRLGLSELRYEEIAEQVEAIYHNGALVNFVQTYKTLKAPNVLGTEEVLRLACYGKNKAIHYISTLSVFSEAPVVNPHGYQENDEPKLSGNLVNGYAQSKWVAEKIMRSARDRGFQVSIYRPASVAGDSRTGAWNTEDFLCRLIKGCIQMGYAPVERTRMDMAPVDYVSRAIVALSLQPSLIGGCFHVNHPLPLYSDELFNGFSQLGYHLDRLPYQDWMKKVLETSEAHHKDFALLPLLTLFVGQNRDDGAELLEKNTIHYDCNETQGILSKLGIECALMDAELLVRYQAYFMRNGFIRDSEYYKQVF